MIDLLEEHVRDLYIDDAESLDLNAAMERVRAKSSMRQRPRRTVWALVGATGTAAIAAIVAAVLLLGSTAPVAYAGWTATPSVASPHQINIAVRACTSGESASSKAAGDDPFDQKPVLTESRDLYTSVIVVSHGDLYSCLKGPLPHGYTGSPDFSEATYGRIGVTPNAGHISPPYARAHGTGIKHDGVLGSIGGYSLRAFGTPRVRVKLRGGGYGPSVVGRTGRGVSAVTFTLKNGNTVNATVQNGWYFAWWPWNSPATSVQVTTDTGTTTSSVTSGS